MDLVGRAYNMRTAGSIHGVYSAVAADGAGEVRLRNFHGVVLQLLCFDIREQRFIARESVF